MSILYLRQPLAGAQVTALIAGLVLMCTSFWFPPGSLLRNSGGGLIAIVILIGANRIVSTVSTARLAVMTTMLSITAGFGFYYDRGASQILSLISIGSTMCLLGLYLRNKRRLAKR